MGVEYNILLLSTMSDTLKTGEKGVSRLVGSREYFLPALKVLNTVLPEHSDSELLEHLETSRRLYSVLERLYAQESKQGLVSEKRRIMTETISNRLSSVWGEESGVNEDVFKSVCSGVAKSLVYVFAKEKLVSERGGEVKDKTFKRLMQYDRFIESLSDYVRGDEQFHKSLGEYFLAECKWLTEAGFTPHQLPNAVKKLGCARISELLRNHPWFMVVRALRTKDPETKIKEYVSNREFDLRWVRGQLSPGEVDISLTVSGESYASEDVRVEGRPPSRAKQLLGNHRFDRRWVKSQLTPEDGNIDGVIAGSSFTSPGERVEGRPPSRAKQLLGNHRFDRRWVKSQLTPEDGDIDSTIANHSFISSEERIGGESPLEAGRLLRCYRFDRNWVKSQLIPEDGNVDSKIADVSFTSSEERIDGKSPSRAKKLLESYRSDVKRAKKLGYGPMAKTIAHCLIGYREPSKTDELFSKIALNVFYDIAVHRDNSKIWLDKPQYGAGSRLMHEKIRDSNGVNPCFYAIS